MLVGDGGLLLVIGNITTSFQNIHNKENYLCFFLALLIGERYMREFKILWFHLCVCATNLYSAYSN